MPFTRPTDYFAETVRSDETMQKVKAKLVEEATTKKAAAEVRARLVVGGDDYLPRIELPHQSPQILASANSSELPAGSRK